MDITRLQLLVPFLRANGVRRFKDGDTEIEYESALLPETRKKDEIPGQVAAEAALANLPPDLKDLDLMKADAIRDWSAPPDAQEDVAPLAGTGDGALEP